MTAAKMDFQVKGEDPVKKKLLFSIVCCFMAVLLIGTIPATAAGVEDIDAFVQEVWPEALPLNLSVEEAGVRLDVISGMLTENRLLIVYTLTDLENDRISRDASFNANVFVNTPWAEAGDELNEILYFDIANHKVFAKYSIEFTSSLPEGFISDDSSDTIQFTVNEFISHEKTVADLWRLAADQDYTVDAVPAPVAEPGLEIIGYSEYSEEAREHIPKVLNPENNLHIPIAEDVELSGIGWIDGNLHVQIHMSNWHAFGTTRSLCYIDLRDQQGKDVRETEGFYEQLLRDTPYYFWGVNWRNGGEEQWIEKIFPVFPEDMDQYMIYCEIEDLQTKYEELLNSEWTVSFPVNLIQAE